jgi:hypothetical protein
MDQISGWSLSATEDDVPRKSCMMPAAVFFTGVGSCHDLGQHV